MTSLFDEIIDRKNTDSLKYDAAIRRGKPDGILPLWVADMDFKTLPAVIDALTTKAQHGIFGYSNPGEDYFTVLQSWFERRHNWQIKPAWLVNTPGVVFAICTAIRALTKQGDAVLIQQPVYYPFTNSILHNKRKLVVNQLIYEQGRYKIDFADFEAKIVCNNVKLFILCSPHNPVGRVWSEAELRRLGDICLKHGVLVVADEIHADFIYAGHQHLVFANLKPAFADITITCTAPSKTFNLAGLQTSNIIITNKDIRCPFRQEIAGTGYDEPNVMGLTAGKAAYAHGEPWLAELQAYLAENLEFLRGFLRQNLPPIKLVEPEGTYLVWLDCQALHLNPKELEDLFVHKAKLWLDTGTMFGAGGAGFERINIACPRPILEKALTQLAAAVNS